MARMSHAASAEVINDCSGERSTFGWIGPRPRFVEKDQIAALRPRMNPQNRSEVPREG